MAAKKNAQPKPKKPKKPSTLRAKAIPADDPQADLLTRAQDMVSAQGTSSVGASLAPEAAAVKAAIATVQAKTLAQHNAAAVLATADSDVVDAVTDLVSSMTDFTNKALKVSKNDPKLLASLAVPSLPTVRGPKDTGPAAAVTGINLAEGTLSGDLDCKWARPKGAAAFVLQYKVEPAGPPQPGTQAPDWLPGEGYFTKNIDWTITGLPPAASVRVRIRAIGAQVGPWSDEVLGKAR
jgi:hypothetical protein